MRYSQGHNFPIFDDVDVADLNDYSDKLAEALENATGDQDERIDEQLRNMTLEDPSSAEIVDARGGYNLLRYRLEADETNISSNTTKINKKVYYYNSIAEMKADTNLKVGDVVQTSGYYSANDGGRGTYRIISTSAEENGGFLHRLNNGLSATLLTDNWVNVKQMGAKGDGTTDDTAKIQLAFSNASRILFPYGTFMIDTSTPLAPRSNSNIFLSQNAVIKAIATDAGTYKILNINNKSNIIIEGGTIQGERSTHTGSGGEWGHGISIVDGTNITLRDICVKDCWGDGVYIGSGTNIKTENVTCDNNRRQGISIISVNGYRSLNDRLINTNGTAPQSGMDIEPNYDTDIIRNVVIENLYTENNSGDGLEIFLLPITSNTNRVEITVKNHTDKGSKKGVRITKTPTSSGFIKLINCEFISNIENGIYCDRCFDSDLQVDIIRPKVINANANSQSGTTGRTAFEMSSSNSTYSTYPLGNVNVIEPYFDQTINEGVSENIPCVYCRNTSYSSVGLKRVKIINPIYLSNPNITLGSNAVDSQIIDELHAAKFEGDTNTNMTEFRFRSLLTNKNFTADRTVEIQSSLAIGSEFEIRSVQDTYNIIVYLRVAGIFGLDTSTLPTNTKIKLKKGAILKAIRTDTNTLILSINNKDLYSIVS